MKQCLYIQDTSEIREKLIYSFLFTAKEQATQLGGAVMSGAGNIAAATGLVKKDEFPSDLNVGSVLNPPFLTKNRH